MHKDKEKKGLFDCFVDDSINRDFWILRLQDKTQIKYKKNMKVEFYQSDNQKRVNQFF